MDMKILVKHRLDMSNKLCENEVLALDMNNHVKHRLVQSDKLLSMLTYLLDISPASICVILG